MRIRVKFTREDRVKFLGHLDIMRSFQRCFNRAHIKMIYSEGFNPHQKMNFAQPLGVGVLSRGDYLDAEVEEGQDPLDIMNRMNEKIGEGFKVTECRILEEKAEKCMAALGFADYEIRVNEGRVPDISHFLEAEKAVTLKKSKSGEKEVDIKPLVAELSRGDDENMIKMRLHAGSEDNLNPVLLMQVLYGMEGLPFERYMISVIRTEMYTKDMVPLSRYQTL